ncbi:D-Ala-D-Ala carboxypeptidase family metallohydrolase [Vreelandella sulfidaeris]
MTQFAPNFPRHEFEASQTATRRGIDNTIPDDLLGDAAKLSWFLQELRNKINRIHRSETRARELPVIISSGYRCLELNKAIGGATKSQHSAAQAADISVPGMTSQELVEFIAKHMPNYDQLIEEFGRWVHVSIADKPRGSVLAARKVNGKTVYSPLAVV